MAKMNWDRVRREEQARRDAPGPYERRKYENLEAQADRIVFPDLAPQPQKVRRRQPARPACSYCGQEITEQPKRVGWVPDKAFHAQCLTAVNRRTHCD